jgi:hypothetical protein
VHIYLAHYSISPDSWLFEVRTSVPRPKVHVIGRDAYSGALRQALHPSIFCDTVGERTDNNRIARSCGANEDHRTLPNEVWTYGTDGITCNAF